MNKATIISVLNEVIEYLDPYVDVKDGSYGEPAPNRAMSLTVAVQDLIDNLLEAEMRREAKQPIMQASDLLSGLSLMLFVTALVLIVP